MTSALVAAGLLLAALMIVPLFFSKTRHAMIDGLLHGVIHCIEHLQEKHPRGFDWTLIVGSWAFVLVGFFGLWFGFWLLAGYFLSNV